MDAVGKGVSGRGVVAALCCPHSHVEPPVCQCGAVFGDRFLKEQIRIKGGHWGWVPIQYDWCPQGKGRLGYRHTEGSPVGTQGEGSHLQAKERDLEGATLWSP